MATYVMKFVVGEKVETEKVLIGFAFSLYKVFANLNTLCFCLAMFYYARVISNIIALHVVYEVQSNIIFCLFIDS